jgi:broad specificity phosphatase PhoE
MALPPVPFLYLRHGETDWNAALRAQGRSDIPLNATGRAQAEAAAAPLARLPIDAIVHSPLDRAAETARIVATKVAAPLVVEPDLAEVSFGVREGESMGPWYERWLHEADTPDGGESFAALTARAERALAAHLLPGRLVLFVAHGALFRAVRAVLGAPIDQRLANAVPYRCTPAGVEWTIDPVM